tara:strand:- start:27154 stop:27510 length:357 start_codon:yes stop_codon:yes gene_type:complete
MQINYKAPTIDLTDEIRNYTEAKVAMVQKLIATTDENVQVDVELSKANQQSGEVFRADITIHAGADRTHAVGHGESMLAAIDNAKDELAGRLRRAKDKKQNAFRKGGAKIKKMLRFWK